MVKESRLTSAAFFFAIIFYGFKLNFPEFFNTYIIEISTYTLIGLSALLIFANINQLKLLYGPILGTVTFATVYLGVLLAGTRGLDNSSPQVIEGLTRIVVTVFAVWKLSADMRNLKLEIDPFSEKRSKIKGIFYGILYPPKEFARLLKVILYILVSFYFIFTGLNLVSTADVNISFLQKTERLSINILFFGIQTPMMMASRASVSKTFSEYLQNLEWAEAAFLGPSSNLSDSYRRILNTEEISYDSISSNGKHLWLTVLLIIILQAFENQILALDLFAINYGGFASSVWEVFIDIFSNLF